MSTSAQIAANRENAQHSTGPRTDDGKAASSKNATTHGLCSRDFVVEPERQAEFDSLVAGNRAELQPEGDFEEDLFIRIMQAAWRIRRCNAAEADLFRQRGHDPLHDPECADQLRLYELYSRRASAEFSKLVKELRTVQTERQLRVEIQPPHQFPDADQTMRTAAILMDTARIHRELDAHTTRRTKEDPLWQMAEKFLSPPQFPLEQTNPIDPDGGAGFSLPTGPAAPALDRSADFSLPSDDPQEAA